MKSTLLAASFSLIALCSAAQPPAPARSEKKLLAVVTSSRADAQAIARANRLTDRMAQHLKLNNYQTSRLRTLNRERARRMYELEHQAGVDPRKIDEDCQGVCREQERDLRSLLSTTQYSDYYEARSDFYSFDKQYLAQVRDQTRPANTQRDMVLPGSPAAPELKETSTNAVLRQGK